MARFTFAVIADSHFHPPGMPTQAAWEADRWFEERNRAVVAAVRQAEPAFVVHLGDVPHPVPGLSAHDRALDLAQAVYRDLGVPLYVVPGNHDVGDKPHPLTPVVAESAHAEAFGARWGPLHQAFDHGGWRFLCIDTPTLNTGSAREAEQWTWLEAEVAALAGRPWMAMLHYPPYLLHPDEPEHYDNLAEPGRSRLLGLLDTARAAFCGHVHHFFWHPRAGGELVLAPSTAFVRPGFAELSRIGPGPAFGRDDTDKLGFFFVHVDGDDHRWELVRSHHVPTASALRPGRAAPPTCPLGVTLRHRWDAVTSVPADGLDPFGRKDARDDQVLLALLEAGVRRLRLPAADLARAHTRERLSALRAHGFRVQAFGTEPVTDLLADEVEVLSGPRHPPAAGRWARVTRAAVQDGERFDHFPAVGFDAGDPALPPGAVERVPHDMWPWDAPLSGEVALVELPRGAESRAHTDGAAVACRVAEALLLAAVQPERQLYLDAFVDHDRGYFPRGALVDRRGNPREAHRVLCHLNRLLPRPCAATAVHREGCRVFDIDGLGELWLPGAEAELPAGVDLATGHPQGAGATAWPRLCT